MFIKSSLVPKSKFHIFNILLILIVPTINLSAQKVDRNLKESKENFVRRVLESNGHLVGPGHEFSDTSFTTLIYSEIIALSPIPKSNSVIDPFRGVKTVTILYALNSSDNIHFNKIAIDTLDKNSGCCPCHQPAYADGVIVSATKNMANYQLIVVHPVKPDCNSMTHEERVIYSDLLAVIRENRLNELKKRRK